MASAVLESKTSRLVMEAAGARFTCCVGVDRDL